jgi:hypothetical protein
MPITCWVLTENKNLKEENMQLTGAEAIVKCLEEQGVEVMFGFPGGVMA